MKEQIAHDTLTYVQIDDAIKVIRELGRVSLCSNLISNQLSNSLVSVEISGIYFD